MNDTFFGGNLNIPLVHSLLAMNFVMTLPLNCYNIWLTFTGTKRTTESDIFSLNLALSENLFSLNIVWWFLAVHTVRYNFMYPYLFSLGFLFTARPLFQTCICVDYYLGVVHPVVFLKYKPIRYRVAICCAVWLVILASCICSYHYFMLLLYHYAYFIQSLFFMACVIYCCLSVLKTLKNPGPGENTANKHKSHKPKRKAFKIIFLILISMTINFIFTVAPIPLQSLIQEYQYMEVLTICMTLSLFSGIMQPLLYLHRADKLTCYKNA